MKVLFAEDEPDLQEVVTAYLELQGYHVTAVGNGAEAVEKARSDACDAIVLDVMMPTMDGVSAMRRIRELGNTVPAIFLTAKAAVADRVEGLGAGADDYLTKPFAMEELSARLRALYRRRREYKLSALSYGIIERPFLRALLPGRYLPQLRQGWLWYCPWAKKSLSAWEESSEFPI